MTGITGYELSRRYWDFAFENQDKITPTHGAIYFFAIEQWNRFGQCEKFGFPSYFCMAAIGIKSKNTFYKCFNDLVEWNFIKIITKSQNQNTANIISLNQNLSRHEYSTSTALDMANIRHIIQHEDSKETINKQSNKETNKQSNKETNEFFLFSEFQKKYKGTKRGAMTEFENFKKKNKDWKDILPLLLECLEKQIQDRAVRSSSGGFVPEWKNLSTWINQRCWEEEVSNSLPEAQKELSVWEQKQILENQRVASVINAFLS